MVIIGSALMVFWDGLIITDVAVEYSSMGDTRDIASFILVFLIIASVSVIDLLSTGTMISESTSAPIDTKNDRKIHNATEVSAEVAIPLKQIEKSIARPSQNEI